MFRFHTDPAAVGSGFRLEWYNEGCGGHLTHPEGSLLSPNYPRRYNHEYTCIWTIEVEYGNNIQFTINDLDLEKSENCVFDSFTIAHDRAFNNSIVKLCQHIHEPMTYLYDGHRAYVLFDTDESHNGNGFNVSYKAVPADCGGEFYVSGTGIIKSPLYPTQNYDFNKTCEWNLKSHLSHTLSFQLIDLDLEMSKNCTKDSLEIFDPIFNETLFRGCGSQLPNTTIFKSKRNELTVRLTSDATINAKGFRGNYSLNCGARIVTNDSGDFYYRRSTDDIECIWTIISEDPSKHVTLTFTYTNIFVFDTECVSRIEVYEGDNDSSGAMLTSFCGGKSPPALVSNGNAITVKLNTTSIGYWGEFDIHYSVLDNGNFK
jgi:cubilin